MRKGYRHLVAGPMDKDSDVYSIPDEAVRDALNTRVVPDEAGTGNVRKNIKGNTEVANPDLPVGTNKVIGSVGDEQSGSITYFVFNSNNDHTIYQWFAETGVIRRIARYNFGWTQDQKITTAKVVDGKLLYWCDPQPRKINLDKAANDKQRKVRLVNLDFNQFYEVKVLDENGVQQVSFIGLSNDYKDMAADINAGILSNFLTAEACDEYVDVTLNAINTHTVTLQNSNNSAIGFPLNFYPSIDDRVIDQGKYPPECEPDLDLGTDSSFSRNFLTRDVFQFRVRYLYDDYEKSVPGPISDIAIPQCGVDTNNFIDIDFSDSYLNTQQGLCVIRGVEVWVRSGNSGEWQVVETLESHELWRSVIGVNAFRFYNDGIYDVADTQTGTKLYDALPREANGQVFADNRLIDGGLLENYDKPCLDASIEKEFVSGGENVFTLKMRNRIFSKDFYGTNVSGSAGPIASFDANDFRAWGGVSSSAYNNQAGTALDQYVPEAGFVNYLAGTQLFGISRQIDVPTLPQLSDGSLDATTAGNRTDIQTYLQNGGDIYSEVEIKGVPPGTYIWRLASHWCSFGDEMDKGKVYDLNSSGAWQKTSTNVFRFVLDTVFDVEATELIIDIKDNGNWTIYDGTTSINSGTSTNGEIFVGEAFIYDFQSNSSTATASARSGYFIDAGGSSDPDDLATSNVFPEKQLIESDITLRTPMSALTTDHNGYFFFYHLSTAKIEVSGVQGTTGARIKAKDLTDAFYTNFPSGGSLVTNAQGNSILDALDKRELGNFSPDNELDPGGGHFQILLYVVNPVFTDECRTRITGQAQTATGDPVPGVVVAYGGTGRSDISDVNGDFLVLVYGDPLSGTQNDRVDFVLLNSDQDCDLRFGTDFSQIFLGSISPFGITYDDSNNYVPAGLNPVIVAYGVRTDRLYLKSGGSYEFVAVFTDELHRPCDLMDIEEISLPFVTEDVSNYFPSLPSQLGYGVFNLTLDLTSAVTPPPWAKTLRVLRSRNANYNDYLWFPVDDVKYVQSYDSANQTVFEASFDSGTANEVYLDVTSALTNYLDFNSQSQKGWVLQDGDRVRLIRKSSGELYTQLFDLPIKAERTDSDTGRIYWVIDNVEAVGEIIAGTLLEIYTPKLQVDNQQFYEIACIPIVNGTYSQTSVDLTTGDTYHRTRNVPISPEDTPGGVVVSFVEDHSLSDNFSSRVEDIGRIRVKNPDFAEILRETGMRHSGTYIPDTRTNDLNAWNPIDAVDLERRGGAINHLVVANDDRYRQVVLAIQETMTESVYIGEVLYSDIEGQDVIALADSVLGTARILKGDYGTINPESVAEKDGKVLWWDATRQRFIGYALNGLTPISDAGIKTYVRQYKGQNIAVYGGYDSYHNEYVATFEGTDTVAFSEGWYSRYSFTPEAYSSVREEFVSFVDGKLWVHNTGPYSNFYGQQQQAEVTVVLKPTPMGKKVFFSLRVKGSRKWSCPTIGDVLIPANEEYPNGMSSRLPSGNFKALEGDYWGALLRDATDPRFTNQTTALLGGRVLRGDVIILKLVNDSDELATIRSVEVYAADSELTES